MKNENKVEKQKNRDSDEVVNAFNMVTDELKENLNEMTRQKKQIETMILHMTDGIIAFNIEGNIIGCMVSDMLLAEDTNIDSSKFITKDARLIFNIIKILRDKKCAVFDEIVTGVNSGNSIEIIGRFFFSNAVINPYKNPCR